MDSRPRSVIQPQSWVGAEAASVIPGIPKPAWLQSATWADTSRERVWRAQEMELVTELVVAVTGTMLTAPPDRVGDREHLGTRRQNRVLFRTPPGDGTVPEMIAMPAAPTCGIHSVSRAPVCDVGRGIAATIHPFEERDGPRV